MSANQTRPRIVKRLQALPLLIGLLFISATSLVSAAHPDPKAAPLTRDEVKMERDEFLRTHRYEGDRDSWVLIEEVDPPMGVKSRAEVKAERDEFFRMHRWDLKNDRWMPVATPRDMSKLTRAQVKEEARQFLRTHRWDPSQGGKWVPRNSGMKK